MIWIATSLSSIETGSSPPQLYSYSSALFTILRFRQQPTLFSYGRSPPLLLAPTGYVPGYHQARHSRTRLAVLGLMEASLPPPTTWALLHCPTGVNSLSPFWSPTAVLLKPLLNALYPALREF